MEQFTVNDEVASLLVVVPVVMVLKVKLLALIEQVAITSIPTSKLPVAVAANDGAAAPMSAAEIEAVSRRFIVTDSLGNIRSGFGRHGLTSRQEGES